MSDGGPEGSGTDDSKDSLPLGFLRPPFSLLPGIGISRLANSSHERSMSPAEQILALVDEMRPIHAALIEEKAEFEELVRKLKRKHTTISELSGKIAAINEQVQSLRSEVTSGSKESDAE